MSTSEIAPFSIVIAQAELDDLQRRLEQSRFASSLPIAATTSPGNPGERSRDGAADWQFGTAPAYLQELVTYWRTSYDWRAAERELNAYPQFTTEIDGQSIHFLHIRSAEDGAIPLLLTHGWPGSFIEFLDVVGPLTDPVRHGGGRATEAFDVVIPSIPGFGFSSPVTTQGWGTERIAAAWLELMTRLGYDRFGVQGGDLGATISPEVARLAPERVIGVHVNGSLGMPVWAVSDEEKSTLSDLERDRVARVEAFMRDEYGYIAIQSTRPQTLAAALVDSPVGQLAWIVDKVREWTFPHEALPDAVIGRDLLLTNVMIYWLTRTAGSAAWIGYAQPASWGEAKASSGVPTAAIMFAHDVGIRRYAERENTIARWTDVDHGGHFAALEEPELLVADLRAFFGALR